MSAADSPAFRVSWFDRPPDRPVEGCTVSVRPEAGEGGAGTTTPPTPGSSPGDPSQPRERGATIEPGTPRASSESHGDGTGALAAGTAKGEPQSGPEKPAQRLRRAADLLEQRAAAATPGPWRRHRPGASVVSADLPDGEMGRYRDGIRGDGSREQVSVVRVQTWEGTGQFVRARSGRDLDWIALANPAIAAPLAAWLRDEADDPDPYAEQLADVILGGAR